MGGPGFELFRFKDDHSPIYDHTAPDTVDDPAVRRRTVYRFIVRSVPNPFLECLDGADPNINTPVRNSDDHRPPGAGAPERPVHDHARRSAFARSARSR